MKGLDKGLEGGPESPSVSHKSDIGRAPVKLAADDIKVGTLYRARRFQQWGFAEPLNNDRVVLWIDSLGQQLQYDSHTVANGRHYPTTTVAAFLRWARCVSPDHVVREAD